MGQAKAFAVLVLVTLIWGATPACGKILSACLSPFLITGMRFASIAAILFLWLFLTGRKKELRPNKHLLILMTAMGFVGIAMHNSLLFTGLHYTTATNAALIESIGPTATTILAFLFIGERLTKFGWLGIVISCLGALCIVTKGSINDLLALKFNIGDVIILICEVAWSLYIIIGWKTQGKISAVALTAWTGAIGALFCFFFGGISGTLEVYQWNRTALFGFLYLVIASGVIAFVGWNWAVTKVGASKAGAFIYIVPLTGAIVGVVFLGEELLISQIFGALLIVCGVAITVKAKVTIHERKQESKPVEVLDQFPELKASYEYRYQQSKARRAAAAQEAAAKGAMPAAMTAVSMPALICAYDGKECLLLPDKLDSGMFKVRFTDGTVQAVSRDKLHILRFATAA